MFIVIEGMDGSGKTLQAHMAHETLVASGYECKRTREPGGTPEAEKIRELMLQNELMGDTQVLLAFAARMEHQKVIDPCAGSMTNHLVCDRYALSSYVYNVVHGGGDFALLKYLCNRVLSPDLLIRLRVPFEECLRRTSSREVLQNDVYENQDGTDKTRMHHAYNNDDAVKQMFPSLMSNRNIWVDGVGDPMQVHERVMTAILKFFQLRGVSNG